MATTMTINEIMREVRVMDPALKANDDEFKTAVLMLAALQLGSADLSVLATFTGLPLDYIEPRAERLRAARIWTDDGKTACQWFEEGGGIAFWMDVCVAEGLMTRA